VISEPTVGRFKVQKPILPRGSVTPRITRRPAQRA